VPVQDANRLRSAKRAKNREPPGQPPKPPVPAVVTSV
jgi:hypothetical protein